ncbi:MAG: hypothetical protein AAF736_19620 [Pseudomonadota bacterium]
MTRSINVPEIRTLWALVCSGALVTAPAFAGEGQSAPLTAAGPNPAAPAELAQYGALKGSWSCESSSQGPNGEWQTLPGRATWSWYYVLDGHAVQDVWKPAAEGAPWGTNLRTYDAEKKRWHMVWATQAQPEFDYYEATYSEGMIVMRGENPPRTANIPPHAAKITFYNMSDEHFDWKYEATAPGSDSGWSPFSRISCDRLN